MPVKTYFSHYWKHVFQVVETLMVVLMGLLMFLLQETGFELMQTDLPTKKDACCFCNNSFFPFGENIFQIVEALILSVGKTVILPLVETYYITFKDWLPSNENIPIRENTCFYL